MVNAKYTAKVLRDGGLSGIMLGLVITKSLENAVLNAAALVCAVGSALSVMIRMPLVIKELNGFVPGRKVFA